MQCPDVMACAQSIVYDFEDQIDIVQCARKIIEDLRFALFGEAMNCEPSYHKEDLQHAARKLRNILFTLT